MPKKPFDLEELLLGLAPQQPQIQHPPAPPPYADPRMAQLQGQMDAMDQPKKPGLADILSTIGRGVSTMNPAQFQQIELQRQQQEQQGQQQKRQMLAQQIQQIRAQQQQDAATAEDKRRYDQGVATDADRYGQQMDIKGAEVAGRQMGSLADINQQGVVNDRAERGLRLQEQAATAPKADSSLTPFELWAKQNPDGKVSDWFKLSEKPTAAGSQDQDWVIRNGEVTPIAKGTAKPGDKPYEKGSATTPGDVGANYSTERTKRAVETIDELLPMVNGWTTGYGSLLKNVPATDSLNFSSKLKTLESNLGFNELQEMRNASKTGGALGNVSDKELTLLTSTLAALNQAQDAATFRNELGKAKASLQRWEKAKAQYGQTGGGGQRGAPVANPNRMRFDDKGNPIK